MSDPIRAALDAAERETTTAGTITAFLRALPGGSQIVIPWGDDEFVVFGPEELAAAIEAAAKETPDA
jgi:hypothetical protein